MQGIIKEVIIFIPQAMAPAAAVGHGMGNAQKMFVELGRQVLINRLFFSQFQGNLHHAQAIKAHPGRAV